MYFGSLISTPLLVINDQIVNFTPDSENTSTSLGENPKTTFAIAPRLLEADVIVAFQLGFVGSKTRTLSSSERRTRRTGSLFVPSQCSSSSCEPFSEVESDRDQRMCLHRVTASCGNLYVVRTPVVVAERIMRRPGFTVAMSVPSGEGTECWTGSQKCQQTAYALQAHGLTWETLFGSHSRQCFVVSAVAGCCKY